MKKHFFSIALFLLATSIFAQNAPMSIWGGGLDGSTYQKTVIYSDVTYGLLFEAPLNASSNKLNIEFNWRGGGIPPLHIKGNNGFIGIGTTSPTRKLTISDETWGGTQVSNLFALKRQYGDGVVFGTYVGEYITDSYGFTISQRLVGQLSGISETFRITNAGNVGIGTTTPKDKLEVDGSIIIKNGYNLSWGGTYGANVPTIAASIGTQSGINFYPSGSTAGVTMRLDAAGNVGIGTTTPPAGFKLAVAGKILAEEVQVSASGTSPWPDYVFEPTYKLRTLAEVEQFVNENKHLPDVPSKTQVDEQGISLGEMNAILLQKIEELTLYTIEQEKEITKLKEENKRIELLENKYTNLEELINQMNK